jgi:uncharacterized membrane protein YfcA
MNTLTAIVLVGALAGGFVQGLSGFAFGLVAMAFWAWVVAPQIAGPLVVFGSLVGQLLTLGSLRRSFRLPRLWPFVLGGCVGTPIGVWMLHYVDPTQFKLAVGLILVAYCPLMLFIGDIPRVTAGGRLAEGGIGGNGGRLGGLGGWNGGGVGKAGTDRGARGMNVIRHPEVRAQRALKGDGPGASAAPFEARLSARTSG